MHQKRCVRSIGALAAGMALAAHGVASPASAQTNVTRRPIGDFIAAQGSLPAPPGFTANFIGWIGKEPPGAPDAPLSGIMTFDYAGLDARAVNDALGAGTVPEPGIRGRVIERTLADGQTNVKVRLLTSNEFAYVHLCGAPTEDNMCPAGDVSFGVSAQELIDGADPAGAAYGSSTFEIEYNVDRPRGAPMEDLIALFFTGLPYESLPISVVFSGRADGGLRAPSGCPEGTQGHAWTVQTGLILAAIQNGFTGALADAFPAEWLEIRPVCE